MKTDKDIESENLRLERSPIDSESKERIRDFLTDLRINNASNDRIIYYAIRLRQMATMLGDRFLNPTEDDLRKALDSLMQHKIGKTKGSGGKYSESAIQAFKIAMRGFYKWQLGEDNSIITWIKVGARVNRGKKPVQPLTETAVSNLASATGNQRDKTLIWLLFDSGCRIGELLTLAKEDVIFDNAGMLLKVSGKTGFRQVRVVGRSTFEMQKWLKWYPFPEQGDKAWIFCVLAGDSHGQQLKETNVRGILKAACRKSGIHYRVYAHLFRHTRATLLAQNVAQAPLSKQMGWTQGSQMTKVYVHLSDQQQDEAIIRGYQKEKTKESTDSGGNNPERTE